MMTTAPQDQKISRGLELLSEVVHPATMAAIVHVIETVEPNAPQMRLCPKCNGQKQVFDKHLKKWITCPQCNGTGWWGG
jgi:DnaJ-class molecular chaperone